jgi:hypothetical protein
VGSSVEAMILGSGITVREEEEGPIEENERYVVKNTVRGVNIISSYF